jgi:hypothetical protein
MRERNLIVCTYGILVRAGTLSYRAREVGRIACILGKDCGGKSRKECEEFGNHFLEGVLWSLQVLTDNERKE